MSIFPKLDFFDIKMVEWVVFQEDDTNCLTTLKGNVREESNSAR